MKVRYRLLGDTVYPASLVSTPNPLSRSETVEVLEIDAGVPLQIGPPGDGVEFIDATDTERQRLQSAGYTARDH